MLGLVLSATVATNDPCDESPDPTISYACFDRGDCPPIVRELALTARCYRRAQLACAVERTALDVLSRAPENPVVIDASETQDVPVWVIITGGIAIAAAFAGGIVLGGHLP